MLEDSEFSYLVAWSKTNYNAEGYLIIGHLGMKNTDRYYPDHPLTGPLPVNITVVIASESIRELLLRTNDDGEYKFQSSPHPSTQTSTTSLRTNSLDIPS